MGIRFECPNGHRLHVKAFLAGERGICPECDARFIVPGESSGRASVVEEVVVEEVVVEEVVVEEVATPPETATSQTVAPPLPAADLSLPDVWYVRSAGGEQYGPADTETMRTWAAEGRVLHDSWVWRTGWPDWKRGGEALALLNVPIEDAAMSIPTAPIPTAPIDVTTSKSRRTRRSNRRDRAKTITVALSALVVLLLAALVLVLSH